MGEEKLDLILEEERDNTDVIMQQLINQEEEHKKLEEEEKLIEKTKREKVNSGEDDELINCLRKELVTVQLVERIVDGITDKNHPFYSGKAAGTISTYVVPRLRNGELKNPLTKAEKDFLEDYMGLEPNALSVHKKRSENFWTNRQVVVQKEGTVLDLSTPMGYINYKILLMNNDLICPSLEDLRKMPKATYEYVLVSDKEVYNVTSEKNNTKSMCWKLYGKVEDKPEVLKAVIEGITNTPVQGDMDLTFLQNTAVEHLEKNPRLFYSVISDPLLNFKVTLKEAVDSDVVERRGDYYYYNNTPLCGKNENPTLTVAAKYISNPRNQEILFSIQARLKR